MKRYLISIEELSEPTHDHRAYDSDEIFSAKIEGDETIVAGVHRVVLDYLETRTKIGGTFYGEPITGNDRGPATN